MMKTNFPTIPLLLAGCLAIQILGSVQAATNPHEIAPMDHEGADPSLCGNCHADSGPVGSAQSQGGEMYGQAIMGSGDGVSSCVECHGSESITHPVGARPKFAVPDDLPLDSEGQVTCLTCHYIHGALHSDTPQASVSVLERMFGSARLHKSYLLRRSNTGGKLCMACHNPNEADISMAEGN